MPDDRSPDASRRQFFRVFSRQAVVTAGSVFGTVNEIRQTGATAAGQLLGLRELGEQPNGNPTEVSVEAAFRSPYRFTDEALLIVDQRFLPDRAEVLECATADLAASAIRAGAAGSGPVLGQMAAYGLVLAVAHSAGQTASQRRAVFRLASSTLRATRFTQRALRTALERMESVDARLADDVAADAHIAALRAEAEAIATDAAVDHGKLGQFGAELLGSQSDPVTVLVHGEGGAMSGGLVGTTFAALTALQSAGKRVDVWLTEGAPTMEGARIGVWELAANDVPHTIISDTAVGWLLSARRIDAVLLRADWACANGDIAAPVGSLGAARLAKDAGVPVHAYAPVAVLDPATPDGNSIPTELRAPVEGRVTPRVDPAADVVPADLITHLVKA